MVHPSSSKPEDNPLSPALQLIRPLTPSILQTVRPSSLLAMVGSLYIYPGILTRILVDASVLLWGQTKTCKLYLSIRNPSPTSFVLQYLRNICYYCLLLPLTIVQNVLSFQCFCMYPFPFHFPCLCPFVCPCLLSVSLSISPVYFTWTFPCTYPCTFLLSVSPLFSQCLFFIFHFPCPSLK